MKKGSVAMDYNEYKIKQYTISPAAGKRLIAKSLIQIPSILEALENRTVVIIAGTTNGYVAEEFLKKINQIKEFSKNKYYRGITLPPKFTKSETGRVSNDNEFIGDVVIVNGKWEKGKTIFDVADQLKKGDVIFKGANAVNIETKQAAILIGHPTAGTISPTFQCVVGRRVALYLPIGLEKRISGDINEIARMLNSPNASGARYMPVSGNIVTELQAINLICGADAELIASGGVCGAEGTNWIAVTGNEEQLGKLDEMFKLVYDEPNFVL